MPKLVKNVIVRPWSFTLNFKDGHEEEITVYAESFAAARLLLPRRKAVGSYRLTYNNTEKGENAK